MLAKTIIRLRKISGTLADRWGNRRFCPLCERSAGRFASYGVPPREDALCPRCGSLERHRLLWHFLREQTNLLDGKARRMLHVAPEPVLAKLLAPRVGAGYLTADLFDPRAMVRMDITAIDRPDESFDVIYCSHVLEHVPDDRLAMRELRRVLAADGWAILLVPITVEQTVEDPDETDPAERLRRFGQEDHVRCYGRDYVDRLREAGFVVDVVLPTDFLDAQTIARSGITAAAGEIYLCRRDEAASD